MRTIALGALFVVVAAACGDKPTAPAECGDGIVAGGEACDLGALNGTFGAGCTASCTLTCSDPAVDCDQPLPCQAAICTTDNTCGYTADLAQDGMACGDGQVCISGACGSSGECGNGVIEGTEECDFGDSNGEGSGCETSCLFSCHTDTDCDDGNACTGEETCQPNTVGNQMGKLCTLGTPPDNGTSCGTNLICLNEACTIGSCGDSFTAGTEECDDANSDDDDGCDTGCRFSCVSTDSTRNCTPADACAGQGTCDDTTHVCSPGTALPDNTGCGTGGYCKQGVCTQPVCGNGTVEPGEDCDEGVANGTANSPCTTTCDWVCNQPADCGQAPACNDYQCTNHLCVVVPDPGDDGMTCGTNQVCSSGACVDPAAQCGNGILETGEQCDFGAMNGANTGCTTSCQYSCTSGSACDDGNACNGVETCSSVTVNGQMGQRCTSGTAPAENSPCGTGKICKAQACVSSVCGDGYVDSAAGEYCEPPNSATCDSQCRPKVCGDGIRADGEQCDDGNLTKLDGCDHTCKFEQTLRINDLKIAFNTTTYCPANALGMAIGSAGESMITDALDRGVSEGTINVLFHMLGLDDLSGTNDNAVQIGVLGGSPAAGTSYNGFTDLDWWYSISSNTINSSRTPTALVNASITNKVLDSPGPSNMQFVVNFVGVDVTMNMFGVKMRGTVNGVGTPTAATGSSPPGHLASENLDPALQSFVSVGAGANASDRAQYCGSATAGSLQGTLVAASVVETCTQYTTSHTLLDLYVSGCRVLFGIIPVINATQPDTSKDGATYRFQANSQRFVTGCTRNGAAHSLTDCLDKAGYSSLFRMRFGRVIGKP